MNSIVKHTDKWLHALASALIVTVVFIVLIGAGVAGWLAAVLAVVISAAAGVGKEYFVDKFLQHETADVGDLIADGIGIVVGLIPVILFFVL